MALAFNGKGGGGSAFNGGTITTPLTITPSSATTDPLTVTLDFGESFVFSTLGGLSNIVYFEDASGGHPFELTDSTVRLGGSSFIAPDLTVNDGNVTVTLPASSKTLAVLDGTSVYRLRVSPTYLKFHQTAAPDDADLDAGDCALWLDATNGAAKLMVKAKQADGTVRTGSLALA